ncbi:P-loop containing nucleoside triphosphate hydrolase protein [Halteromyces radiatus]|uniref:P-loop containing nucleoside triphosphate hydrolase protein n=1 Tax=Halteromyces radiatus TaxID=101107 RepID=UPI0022207F9F|nr:P-loop containing nucleoside triphosphate hydrolase protein [Halteromyces radiatus]KAI8096574.1 P-loop containing nucleoside triphosphate hydrolase protein [Halteromyces radiatus]
MTKGNISSPSEKIKIICRIRPFLDNEVKEIAVQVDDKNTLSLENKRDPASPLIYKNFSSCYSATATQETIFVQDVRPLIERVFEGYDATIFAYGVTGSGKTYTMQGIKDEPGIIPRVAEFLFETKEASKLSSIDITMSYMEILKESVYDMLTPRKKNIALDIREDINRDVFVANLTEKRIQTCKDFQRLFNSASKNRSTASTRLNSRSSRSHAILTLKVTTITPIQTDEGRQEERVMGKINLIDLAGSEDNRKSGNGKARMTESAAINKSLFVLGQVVEAINNGMTRVPYRDSKMTRILQSTLGGSALGMMIINIAPGHNFFTDTTNTLNFAHRSKEIKSAPKANVRRTRSVTRSMTMSNNYAQQAAMSPTRITQPYPSPNQDKTHRDSKHVTINSISRRLSNLPCNNKRPSDTYEQRMRASKRTKYSPTYSNNKDTNTYNPSHQLSPYNDNYHTLTTSEKNLQRWLRDVPLPTRTSHMPRTWSTITAANHQPMTRNRQEEELQGMVENSVMRMTRMIPMTDDDEELVVMTRSEFNNLRDQLMMEAKREILSGISESD